jgi:hypothetical protein
MEELDPTYVRTRFEPQFAACEALLEFMWVRRPSRIASTPGPRFLMLILTRSTMTYRSVLHLCRGGYADQANALSRSLFEDMVTAFWVLLHPEASFERIRNHMDLQRLVWAEARAKHGLSVSDSPAHLESIRQRRTELTSMFGRWAEKPWSGISLSRMLAEIMPLLPGDSTRNLFQMYFDVRQRYSNWSLHLTAGALSLVMGEQDPGEEALHVDMTPVGSLDRVHDCLLFAYALYSQLLSAVSQGVEFEPLEDDEEGLFSSFYSEGLKAFGL